MAAKRDDFLLRLLYQGQDDQPYWVASPPAPDVLKRAASSIKDEIGFEAHARQFALMTEVIDACASEQVLAASGRGTAFPNTLKHPRILALADLELKDRAGLVSAAAQGVRWIDEIRPWVNHHVLQNEIAKRVMIGILRSSAKLKNCFAADELKALIRLGCSIEGQDSFGPAARVALVEIIAANANHVPVDTETRKSLPKLLKHAASETDLQSAAKAIDKLKSKFENK